MIDIYREQLQFGLSLYIFDPYADKAEVFKEYGINLCTELNKYDFIILAVSHNEFLSMDFETLKKDLH